MIPIRLSQAQQCRTFGPPHRIMNQEEKHESALKLLHQIEDCAVVAVAETSVAAGYW